MTLTVHLSWMRKMAGLHGIDNPSRHSVKAIEMCECEKNTTWYSRIPRPPIFPTWYYILFALLIFHESVYRDLY